MMHDVNIRTMRGAALIVPLVTLLACGEPGESAPPALAIAVEVGRLGQRDLWPGFDPAVVPLAVYDGRRTVLLGHPSPPDGFVRDSAVGGWSHDGRHADVVANTRSRLGGVWTATLIATDSLSTQQLALLAVHEAFHVFQQERHPDWSANEAALFEYPIQDVPNLAGRRLELDALARALDARADADAACWTATALAERSVRYAGIPAAAAEYERATELNEGLAAYVEHRASDRRADEVIQNETFPPDAFRRRTYTTGVALALLLDRLRPDWRDQLEHRTTSLDALLSEMTTSVNGRCAIRDADRRAANDRAVRDVAALRDSLTAVQQAFMNSPGWQLHFIASGSPLQAQSFDPLNVRVLDGGRILHTRFVELGADAGRIEVYGRAALTEPAGGHPLFAGVTSLLVTGLDAAPEIVQSGDTVRFDVGGVSAELRGVSVDRDEARRLITVVLPAG